ncbi:MAG TPA: hypothetical protein VMW69_11605, partial [Spirochaetia bacterium]|nr:hypothetical protein [Spirochaetia bacterium]
MLFVAGLAAIALLAVSCSKSDGSSGRAQTKVVQAQGTTKTLGYPGDWDARTDLVPSEPVDLSAINASFKKQASISGELIHGSVDLAKSDIKYFDRTAKSPQTSSATLPPEKEPLTIVDYGPEGELPIEMRSPTIYVMFNLPIVPLAKLGEPMTSSDIMTIDPAVPGVYRWYGTRTLSFEPSDQLIDRPMYTVHISADTASLGGRKLGKPVTFTLYTETVKIVNFYPGNDPNVYIDRREVPTAAAKQAILEFNQEVDPAYIERFLSVEVGRSAAAFHVGRPSYPASLQTRTPRGLLLTLDREPPDNTPISITLKSGALPRAGYPSRSSDQQEDYHTVTPFRFTRLSSYAYDLPRNNKPQAVPVYASFSQPIADGVAPEDILVAVNGKQVDPLAVESFGRTMRISLASAQPGDRVSLQVTSKLTDIYGRSVQNPGESRSMKMPEPYPYVSFPDRDENLLESSFPPKFIWEARNVLKGDFGLMRSAKNGAQDWKPEDIHPMEIGSWTRNKVIYNVVDLSPYLDT